LKHIKPFEGKNIAALIPCYHQELGNATELVLLEEEPVFLPRTIKTVLANLAKANAIDLRAMRQKYSDILGCVRATPLALSQRLILMPVKVRKPISRNDSSRGYINYLAIDAVDERGDYCAITLKNQRVIDCFHSLRSINQHIRNCHYIHQRMMQDTDDSTSISEAYLTSPATKADIALILNEIREIRKKL
jgi:hypothetical protein